MDWSGIVETWGAVVAVVAGLWAVLRPFMPMLCEIAETYVARMKDERRREVLLILVRAAEEIFVGAKRGEEKQKYVLRTADAWGYKLTEDEVRAAAREVTKEIPVAVNGARKCDPP